MTWLELPPARSGELWVVGDVHGAYDKLRALLLAAGLTDHNGNWTGRTAHLVFLGDYLDRGPDGLGVVRLVRQLEAQARAAGGQVMALLGNHEVMFLAAYLFQQYDPLDRLGFRDYWLSNGGQRWDAERLTPEERLWLSQRPVLARAGDWLLAHADSLFYAGLGRSIEEANARAAELLGSLEPGVWSTFANAFVDRLNFAGTDGEAQASRLLARFGGSRMVHGHTPTYLLLHENEQNLPDDPSSPVEYAGGLCVAADSGMAYFYEAGFVTRLDEGGVAEVVRLPEEAVAGFPGPVPEPSGAGEG